MQPESFLTFTLRSSVSGLPICRILNAALESTSPEVIVHRSVRREKDKLVIANHVYDLGKVGRVLVIAMGKASPGMARAMSDILGAHLDGGLVITKHPVTASLAGLDIVQGGHPLPDERSLDAGQRVVDLVKNLGQDDLVFCLVSGGGSALVAAPVQGISLGDLQSATAALLACGADIRQINTIRCHLDRLKGGGLVRMAAPARVAGLVLSDVVGDHLETVSSGPTVPCVSTPKEALKLLAHLQKRCSLPKSIATALRHISKTPQPGAALSGRVDNFVIGNNLLAAQGALKQAAEEGFNTCLLRTDLGGEASQVSVDLCRTLRWAYQTGDPAPRPACIIAGGETTVTLRGPGRGGRNQELALAAVSELANFPGVMMAALATDGEDGDTDAAGAIVTGDSFRRAYQLGMDPVSYLRRNDSYAFFAALDDLLKPGFTGTNVNDLVFLFTFN